MTKKYCIFLSALFCAFLGVFLVANAVSPDRTFSQMENRNLEQLPVPSVKTLLNGQFMKDFETYTTDQFVGAGRLDRPQVHHRACPGQEREQQCLFCRR